MIKEVTVGKVKWIDGVDLDRKSILQILNKYNFDELDIEACLEGNLRARADSHNNYFFVALHFPKYNPKLKVYELNKFNIFIGLDFIITLRSYSWSNVEKIFEKYVHLSESKDTDKTTISSWHILYEIIQVLLTKMYSIIHYFKNDIQHLEKQIFSNMSPSLVRDIMVKKRNIVVLKNILKLQSWVMPSFEIAVNKLFGWKMEMYFDDLQDKMSYVIWDIEIIEEYFIFIENAYKTMIDIETGHIIRLLTIFSAFDLPLTLITSFYGMNVDLPFQREPIVVFWMIGGLAALMILFFVLFTRTRIKGINI